MAELFPIIQPELVPETNELPIYKEVAWDFESGKPLFQNGAPMYITGKDAVKTWIWKALVTARTKYEIYSWGFGNELESLIGQNFVAATKQSEANRYIREALAPNPYITGVSDVSVDFSGAKLTVFATVNTVYGEVAVSV